jgi:hypothetical protein
MKRAPRGFRYHSPAILHSVFELLRVVLAVVCVAAQAGDLQWTQGPGYRVKAVSVPLDGKVGFTLLPAGVTGINFTNVLSDEKTAENQIRLNGSGIACGDIDGDGWCDIYLAGLENGNRLYRNLGQWKFEDVT